MLGWVLGCPVASFSAVDEVMPDPKIGDTRPDTAYVWYWEEEEHRLDGHKFWDKQNNFVACKVLQYAHMYPQAAFTD